MEKEEIVTGLLLILFVLFFLLRLAFNIPGTRLYWFYKNYLNRHLFILNIRPEYRKYLNQNFEFYKKLGEKEKRNFERRVQRFIDMKQFISRSPELKVSPEMKTVIAGVAVMMTYGFPSIYLRHFWRILIYKDNYYSTITHNYHKGEVNPKGIIVLSWNSFIDGFIDKKDGRNLGIHEMAHALRLENRVINEDFNFIDNKVSKKFDLIAEKEISRIKENPEESTFLRRYAATNKQEFFAVLSESFFENPESLSDYNSELYDLMVAIYRFNPINLKITS